MNLISYVTVRVTPINIYGGTIEHADGSTNVQFGVPL